MENDSFIFCEKKLERDTGNGTRDDDDIISDKTTSHIFTKKSKPITPKSPNRTASRSSTSASSNVSRSPRPRSKASNTSLQSVRQDNTTTAVMTTTKTTSAAAAVSSKRLVRKGLDVSPAMLEFFGMKPIAGPSACFQFMEERELPPSKKKSYDETTKRNSPPSITIDNNDADRPSEITKSQHVKGYVRYLGEPGPEHLPGVENSRNRNDDRYTDNEIAGKEKEKEVELGQIRKSKSREEMKRLARNGLGYGIQQTHEPGPEYFNNLVNGEDDASHTYDGVMQSRGFPILAVGVPLANDVPPTCNIAKEGGGIEEGLSIMVTMNATADAMKSSTKGVTAVAGVARAAATTTTETTVTGISMDSGSGGTFQTILIKGVQIINDDSINTADVLIEDGIIRELSSKIEERQGAQIIDGTDKVLMPAGIEIYTEFSLPDSADDFETSSKAALAGGTATIVNAIHSKPNETLLNAYDRLCKIAQSKSFCNFAFSVIISEWNDMIRKEMKTLVHDKGINSFIIDIQKDEQLFEIFEYCQNLRVHARIIPENKDITALLEKRMRASGISGAECFHLSRPEALEADMVSRISVLSKLTSCPVAVMSLSSSGAAEVLLRQRSNMLIPEIPVAALDDEKSNSALHIAWRYAESPSSVISCLSSLPLCICISGHCKMQKKDSSMENFARSDMFSVEERMSMLWAKGVLSGLIDPMRFVALTSSNAAKVFNLYPKKGRIGVGADADLVLWKLSMKHQTSTASQPSMLEVSATLRKPVMTICGGRIAYNNGKFDLGRGKLVELGSHSPYLYCMLKQVEEMQLNDGVNKSITSYSNHAHFKDNLSNSSRAFPKQNLQKQQFGPVHSAAPEETRGMRASTKVLNPPGGRSTGFW